MHWIGFPPIISIDWILSASFNRPNLLSSFVVLIASKMDMLLPKVVNAELLDLRHKVAGTI
jgi:hypothetical protein